MEEEILIGNPYIYLAIGVFFGAAGAYIVERKRRTHYKGFLVGFFFGIIGVFALLLLKSKKKQSE